jgi:hypothetical protein
MLDAHKFPIYPNINILNTKTSCHLRILALTIKMTCNFSGVSAKRQTIDPCVRPFDLHPYDVLCGRSKAAFNNIGNRRFRILIGMSLYEYMHVANRRKEKSEVARKVIATTKASGGRFLLEKNGILVELTEKEAQIKTGHAIRDLALNRDKFSSDASSSSTGSSSDFRLKMKSSRKHKVNLPLDESAHKVGSSQQCFPTDIMGIHPLKEDTYTNEIFTNTRSMRILQDSTEDVADTIPMEHLQTGQCLADDSMCVDFDNQCRCADLQHKMKWNSTTADSFDKCMQEDYLDNISTIPLQNEDMIDDFVIGALDGILELESETSQEETLSPQMIDQLLEQLIDE